MMQLEVMSEKSTMSAPIPEFCDRKSYDDIRINMIRKHSERREKIVREKEELFSWEFSHYDEFTEVKRAIAITLEL